MKKISAVLILMLAVCSLAYAHPPSDIVISYDNVTHILKAVIYHNVSNTANHYIKKVDIGKNNKEIIEHSISQQDNNLTQTVSYLIPDVKAGDSLSVEAYCSISGKLKKDIIVGK